MSIVHDQFPDVYYIYIKPFDDLSLYLTKVRPMNKNSLTKEPQYLPIRSLLDSGMCGEPWLLSVRCRRFPLGLGFSDSLTLSPFSTSPPRSCLLVPLSSPVHSLGLLASPFTLSPSLAEVAVECELPSCGAVAWCELPEASSPTKTGLLFSPFDSVSFSDIFLFVPSSKYIIFTWNV